MLDTSTFKLQNRVTMARTRTERNSKLPIVSVRFNKDIPTQIYFSKSTAALCKLTREKYVHFINPSAGNWYFIVNDDPAGYKLAPLGEGFAVGARAVIKIMQQTIKVPLPACFYVQNTGTAFNDYNLFEILTHKSVKQMGK